MDINYLRAISREMHEELQQRKSTFAKLIANNKMSRDDANHRFICLEEAKKLIEASINDGQTKVALSKSLEEIGSELLTEVKFRKLVYRGMVYKNMMTLTEMERKIGYFQFAHTLIAPPTVKPDDDKSQLNLF